MKKSGKVIFKLAILGFALFATVSLGHSGISVLDLPYEPSPIK